MEYLLWMPSDRWYRNGGDYTIFTICSSVLSRGKGGRQGICGGRHGLWQGGYAVTSHSSQGQTADRVLTHVDTELGAKDLLNNRMAYVAISRGAYDAQMDR